MSWKSLASPLAVIIVGVLIIGMLLAAPERQAGTRASAQRVAQQDEEPCSSYPAGSVPERCLTPTAYPDAADTPDTTPDAKADTPTVSTTATTTVTTTPLTPLSTATVAVTQPVATAAPRPTSAPTPETAETLAPTSETTPTPVNELMCVPGETITIAGQGPPRAALLLYFDQRVVGGGSVNLSGSFALPLVVGKERPGIYPVQVRVRGTTQVLRELTCEVPPAPTPTLVEPT